MGRVLQVYPKQRGNKAIVLPHVRVLFVVGLRIMGPNFINKTGINKIDPKDLGGR